MAMDAFAMTHQFLLAPLFLLLGWLAGVGHFSLMALQIRAVERLGGRAVYGGLRFAITPAAFVAAAMAGAVALAATLAGFVFARALALRYAGIVSQ
jgi:hypothetical protein